MPETCYQISSSTVSFSSDRKDVNQVVDIIFYSEAIEALGEGIMYCP